VEVTFEAFRCEELHSLLSKSGNTLRKVLLTAKESARRLKVLKLIKGYDLIYIYKEVALLVVRTDGIIIRPQDAAREIVIAPTSLP
jgi:hypothetical protein